MPAEVWPNLWYLCPATRFVVKTRESERPLENEPTNDNGRERAVGIDVWILRPFPVYLWKLIYLSYYVLNANFNVQYINWLHKTGLTARLCLCGVYTKSHPWNRCVTNRQPFFWNTPPSPLTFAKFWKVACRFISTLSPNIRKRQIRHTHWLSRYSLPLAAPLLKFQVATTNTIITRIHLSHSWQWPVWHCQYHVSFSAVAR